MDEPPHNLPVQPTSFVGRVRELSEAGEALASTRLLTLSGAGGCGKTRLALRLAEEALERHPDGAWWLDLAPLSDPARVGSALAEAIGVRPLPGGTPLDAARAHLATRRALVVLDNCEHLVEACAELAAGLLGECPGVTLLATSREPLGIPGETAWTVPSLSVPPELGSRRSAHESGPDRGLAPTDFDAVKLFAERAAEVSPGLTLTGENAATVGRLCRRLDGIPLAIELAAGRARMLSVEEIAAGLDDRFRLLADRRATSGRWRTLRASVDWSHQLLEPAERLLLRRLGVFAGGFTVEAVERTCAGGGVERESVLDLLTSLADRSLVQVEERGSPSRYRLLETVRDYALEQLERAGEAERARSRHAGWCLALAERAGRELRSPRYRASLALLDAEAANLHAAIDWALRAEPETALRLCSFLYVWWLWGGRLADGGAAMERALEASAGRRSALRGQVLAARAYIAGMAADVGTARRRAEEALELGEELGEDSVRARALLVAGNTGLIAAPSSSVASLERSVELARAVDDGWCETDARQMLAIARAQMGDWEEVRRELDRSQELARRFGYPDLGSWHFLAAAQEPYATGDGRRCRMLLERAAAEAEGDAGQPVVAGIATAQIGLLEVEGGRIEEALALLGPCQERMVAAGALLALGFLELAIGVAEAGGGGLAEARARLAALAERAAGGSQWYEAQTLRALARIERLSGDEESAQAHAERALALAERLTNDHLIARAGHELGRLAAARGEWREAERLLHAALGAQVEGGYLPDQPDSLDGLAEVAAGLGRAAEGVRLLAAAARARAELGLVPWPDERRRTERTGRELRTALGAESFAAVRAEGEALSLPEAVAYSRRARGPRRRPSHGWESLTPTELAVAGHAAAGLTNPQIGERMFITRGTVKSHLSRIYAKLDLGSRSELAAEVARRQGGAGS